jgi:hypothetical protein
MRGDTRVLRQAHRLQSYYGDRVHSQMELVQFVSRWSSLQHVSLSLRDLWVQDYRSKYSIEAAPIHSVLLLAPLAELSSTLLSLSLYLENAATESLLVVPSLPLLKHFHVDASYFYVTARIQIGSLLPYLPFGFPMHASL